MVETQLQKMSAGDKMSEQWMAEVKVLDDLVDHHVDEEEGTGFSCARDDFSKDQLEAMGVQFRRRKEELMSRVM